jgi:hypothetical protein
MTLFEFVSVMFSIILGLSLSQMLLGVARLVRDPNEVKTFGPQAIWTATLVLMHFLLWWSIWDFRDVEWNYARFVVASVEPLLLFFMGALLLPSPAGSGSIDLRSHFLRVRPWLMGLYAALMIVFLLDGPLVFQSEGLWSGYRIPQVIALLAVLLGLKTQDARHHHIISLVVLGVILSGSAFRFLPAAFAGAG